MDIKIKGLDKKTMAGLEEIAERKGMTIKELAEEYLETLEQNLLDGVAKPADGKEVLQWQEPDMEMEV